jgi:hypothetical protein
MQDLEQRLETAQKDRVALVQRRDATRQLLAQALTEIAELLRDELNEINHDLSMCDVNIMDCIEKREALT